MIRSMILACAIGALGAVGCVASSDAADESAVAQNTGSGGVFTCDNGVSVVCTGDISILNGITVNVSKTLDNNNVNVLNGGDVSVLENDLNNLKITDINVLDYNKILDDVEVTVLNDFLNKFNINVTKNDIDVCAVVGICI